MSQSKQTQDATENIVDDVIFNFFVDMKKKNIDKMQRAILLRKYMDKHKLSGRALAKELGIPKSTIEDWLLLSKITQEEYDEMISNGMNYTDIYRTLRNNKKDTNIVPAALLAIRETTRKNKSFYGQLLTQYPNIDGETVLEIKELVNVLNRILMRVDR